jgi:ABC-type transport system substrate-binding protein
MKVLIATSTKALMAVIAGLICLTAYVFAAEKESPRTGGELVFAVGGTPPSFDGHRETTFAMLHPVAPHYSTLLRFDPQNYPKIIGDVAESWTISKDALTYTFKIRKGIKFHDGSELSASDVKATYDRLVFPPDGVVSARQATYDLVKKNRSAGREHHRVSDEASVRGFSQQPGVAVELHLQGGHPGQRPALV